MLGTFKFLSSLVTLASVISASVVDPGVSSCPNLYTRFGSSCYNIYPYRFSWIEAQEFCRLDRGHLVFVDNAEEHEFLKTLGNNRQGANISDQLWTGMIEFQGRYIRYAGLNTPAQYLAFRPGEPSSTSRDDCIALVKSKGWLMEDWYCGDNKFSFICEI